MAAPVLMTVTGPLDPSSIATEGLTCCREWLLNDQCDLHKESSELKPGDHVNLRNLLAMRRRPLATLGNLHLSLDDAVAELDEALKSRERAACLLAITTPRAYWPRSAAADWGQLLRSLAGRSGVALLAGTAPAPGRPASPAEIEAEVASLLTDLSVGFASAAGSGEEAVRPGFLGELRLGSDSDAELLALQACVAAQRRSGAALLLSGAVSEKAMAVMEKEGVDWAKTAFFDVPEASFVPAGQLAARGAFLGFCPPGGAGDVARGDYPGRRPWRTEEAFAAALSSSPACRRLASAGLRFRTDLTLCGGAGLGHAEDVASCAGGPERAELRRAAVDFFQYKWEAPRAPEKVVQTVKCHWCKAEKVLGQHFSKYQFDYCSPKCIAKHRQVDFAPEKRGY